MPPMRQKEFKKAKNFWKTLKRMIKDFRPQYVLIIIVIFISICSAVLSIVSPLVINKFLTNAIPSVSGGIIQDTDLFHFESDGSVILQWGYFFLNFGILFGCYILSAFLSWLSEWLAINISTKYSYDMRDKIQRKLDTLPLSYFDKVPYGDTLSIGTNDVDNISRNLQSIITQIFSGIALLIGVIIAMLVTEWRLSLVAFAAVPLILLVVIIISKSSQKQFHSYRKELGILNGKVEEDYAGFKIIKLFNKEKDIINSFNETNEKMGIADKKSQFFSGLIYPGINFINNLAFVGIAVVAGIINQPATMITFFLFLNLFTRPFQQVGQIANVIQSVVASGERIYELLDEEEQVPDIKYAADPNLNDESKIVGSYDFEHVDFSYSIDKPLIEDMNLKVEPGDSIAIVGPTGAGKTTIVNLIMRFYEINNGSIKLDGVDIRNYNRSTIRGIVGMVLQDTWLFRGTLRDNIKYGAPEASEEELIEACKKAHIYHFIETLPGGFDFMLNENGDNISQGQKQLITIARALLSKPKVMILDEATSSVDTRTEQLIQDAMNKIMEGRTSFIIAHRLSTIKNAKLIIVMKKGHIIETGNHKELLAKNGFYADLYNSQFLGSLNSDNSVQDS